MRSLIYEVNVSILQTPKCSAAPSQRGQGPECKRLFASRSRCVDNSASLGSAIVQRASFCDYRASAQHLCLCLNLVQVGVITPCRDQLSV